MNDRQWQDAWEIFQTAGELAPDQLPSYLDSIQTHPDILQQVISMLEEPPEELPPEPASRIGTTLGRYEIAAILGSGAMSDVYSARDMDLGRMVAIKLLIPGTTASRTPMDRLVTEARAASALNHPHIITVYEVIRTEDNVALAMELVEGKSLRDFCDNPPEIPCSMRWGRQIAQALAAAHERNITHRDIKPENVMVRHDGLIKVLDFGLARDDGLSGGASIISSQGLSGTLSYMAPEQLLGQPATSASDVFSLGIVLFELTTGVHPFREDSPIDTAYEIAHGHPKALSTLNPRLPSSVNRLLLAMLERDPSLRPTAAQVATKLQQIRVEREPGSPIASTAKTWLGAAAIVAMIAFAGIPWFSLRDRNRTGSYADLRVQPLTSQVGWEGSPALSPNGDAVAFTWTADLNRPRQIYLRRLNSNIIVRLTDSERQGDTGSLVWSPDGKQLAFKRWYGQAGAIFTIPSLGGTEQKITELANGDLSSSLDWSSNGQLAFSDNPPASGRSVIYLYSLKTGVKRKLTSPPLSVRGDWDPKFSPDGRTIAFKRVTGFWIDDIYTVPVAKGPVKRITSWQRGIWGHAWSREGKDLIVSAQVNGTVFGIRRFPIDEPERQERLTLGGTDAITPTTARNSDRVAWVNETEDLNIYRVATTGAGTPHRLIASVLRDLHPTYRTDGGISFISDRSGSAEIFVSNLDGEGQIRIPAVENTAIGQLEWSPDGRQLAFSARQSGRWDIFLMACERGGLACGKPRLLTSGLSSKSAPSWSGDGRYLYFASDRTGRDEIWRQAVTGDTPVQITRNGGYTAHESSDGQWLYFSDWNGERIWRIPGTQSPQHDLDVPRELVIGPPYRVRPAGWALTSDEIFFVDRGAHQRSAEIRAYRLTTGTARTILGQTLTDRNEVEISVSPDRRWLIYTQVDRSGGNIMVTDENR